MKESKKCIVIFALIMSVLILLSYREPYQVYIVQSEYDFLSSYHSRCDGEETIEDSYNEKICSVDITGLPGTPDIYTVFYAIIRSDILYHLCMFGPFLIIFFSLYYINKLFKSKYLYYYIQRTNYKSFVKSIILSSYKYVLIVPFMIILIYLLSLTISAHGPNDLTRAFPTMKFDQICYDTKFFLIFYTIHIMIRWLSFINVGLVIQSKNRKFIFNIIEFYIIYFIAELVAENIHRVCWVWDIYNPEEYSIFLYIVVGIIYFIISFVMVILAYRNKEKLLARIGDDN